MKLFKDKDNREWEILVNIGQIRVVRDLVKLDLYKLFDEEAKRLFSDPVLLVDTLYALCRAQCATRGMSDEDFGRGFDGTVLEAAADALLEEMLSFFPRSRQKLLRAAVNKAKELTAPVEEEMLKKIAALSATDLLKPTASPESSK